MKQNEGFNETQRDLLAVMDVIRTPERWCQGPMAMDADGNAYHTVEPGRTYARYCLRGATYAAFNGDTARAWHAQNVIERAMLESPKHDARDHCVSCFSDHRHTKHADVMALILRAVEQSKTKVPA